MKAWIGAAALLAGTMLPALPAGAQQVVDRYVARLSPDDHFNSNGKRLTEAAAIVRQDRANFHAFGIRDPEDDSDSFFRSKGNRARMERMLRQGGGSRRALRAIVDGNPLIEVVIYRDSIEVTVLE